MSVPALGTISIFEREEMARRRGQRKGYLFKKGGFWYLQYRVDTRSLHRETGEVIRERRTVQLAPSSGPDSMTRREVQRFAWDEHLSKLDSVSLRPGSMVKLIDFVNARWRPDVLAHLKPSSKLFYETQLRNHVLPKLGNKRLRDISLAHVQEIINERSKTHAPRSVQCVCLCVNSIFQHARRMNFYHGALPTDGARRPEVVREDPQALTWAQVADISRAVPEPVATLVLFLAMTGLRIGEATGLRWKNLDLEEFTAKVRENWVMGKRGTPKSAKSRRNVPFADWLGMRLRELRAASKFPADEDPVFVGSTGSPLDHHNVIKRVLKPKLIELKLGWVAWHTFRRTNSTLAERIGMTVSQRAAVLGHTDPRVTLGYTQADIAGAREQLDKIAPKPSPKADQVMTGKPN